MAKHRRPWNERTYRDFLREGRGRGVGREYKPWVEIHDFASQGVVSRIRGLTTGRVHHFLSRLELGFFLILDWSDRVVDIREQYPLLDVELSLQLAEQNNIRHPRDPKSGMPYIQTTDFLVTTTDGDVARSVKPSKELKNARTKEKLELERAYWQCKGVDWKLVTEHEIDWTKARNIDWLLNGCYLPEVFPEKESLEDCLRYFEQIYRETGIPIVDIVKVVEEDFELDEGLGIAVFQYLVVQRRLSIAVDQPIELTAARAVRDHL